MAYCVNREKRYIGWGQLNRGNSDGSHVGRRTGLWDKNKEGNQEIRNRMKRTNGDYS